MTKKEKTIFFIQLIPVIISFIMIAAHFYRAEKYFPALFLLFIPLILFIKNEISIRLIQMLLFISTIEWWITIYKIIDMRRHFQIPWLRFSIIMSVVALFTLCSILIFHTETMKKAYLKQ